MTHRNWKAAILLLIVFAGTTAMTLRTDNKYFEILKNIEIFTNLYKELNTSYVDDIDPGQIMRKGIDAMVGSLDPFTNYISEYDIEGYRLNTEGRYSGIGASSETIDGLITIVELYQGQPADKAGMKVGDQIISVDGQSAEGKTPDQLNEIMRGFPGTEIVLVVRRPGRSADVTVKLVREEVEVPNVPYYAMISDKVGYVALTTFTQAAGANVGKAISELKAENPNMSSLVLDLRGNGGGLLNEAVNLSNLFIPRDEVVVTTKGKVKDWDRTFKTFSEPLDGDMPLAVLINKRSASASEIVSGVVQDYDRGVLVGQRSYGKGLVQNTADVGYNARVKLTTAKYYIPSQRCIQSVEYKNGEPVNIPDSRRNAFKTRNGRTVYDGGGVMPDIEIPQPTEGGILKGLIDQHLVFHYVTQFCMGKDSIAAVEDFRFTEFDKFVKFLEARNFSYDSESEKLLQQLEKSSAEEGFMLSNDLATLSKSIQTSKRNEVLRHKEAIIDLIEKEIAARYYYQKGRVKMGLRNDAEVKEAISVLNDEARYKKLLSRK